MEVAPTGPKLVPNWLSTARATCAPGLSVCHTTGPVSAQLDPAVEEQRCWRCGIVASCSTANCLQSLCVCFLYAPRDNFRQCVVQRSRAAAPCHSAAERIISSQESRTHRASTDSEYVGLYLQLAAYVRTVSVHTHTHARQSSRG